MFNRTPAIANDIGYEMKTTFWSDFSIADVYGESAIKDTFKRAFDEWKDDKEYGTELCMVLNWKAWQHSKDGFADEIGKLYTKLYYELHEYICNHWKGDKLSYYYHTTD